MNELKMALGQDASEIDEDELVNILKEADLNNDGNINVEDFFRVMYDRKDSIAKAEGNQPLT